MKLLNYKKFNIFTKKGDQKKNIYFQIKPFTFLNVIYITVEIIYEIIYTIFFATIRC